MNIHSWNSIMKNDVTSVPYVLVEQESTLNEWIGKDITVHISGTGMGYDDTVTARVYPSSRVLGNRPHFQALTGYMALVLLNTSWNGYPPWNGNVTFVEPFTLAQYGDVPFCACRKMP